MSGRFALFSDQELATMSVGLAALVMTMFEDTQAGRRTRAEMARDSLVVMSLMDEIGEAMGVEDGRPDPEIRARVEQMVEEEGK